MDFTVLIGLALPISTALVLAVTKLASKPVLTPAHRETHTRTHRITAGAIFQGFGVA
ncbi:hypothetical protein D3C80_1027600 [compost metagenome]